MISPISSDLSLSCAQLYHHLRTRSEVIPLYLSMPWSWLNTEYSIHQVPHHPKIDSLPLPASVPLPASFPSLGRCCCTQLCTFPQRQVDHWIDSQLPSRLPPNRPLLSTPLISLDHSLQVHLQTRSITASQCISEFRTTASKCISELARSRPPSSHNHGLQLHLRTRSITASKCITKLARSRPPSASPNSLDHGLHVHLSTRLITASKYIVNERRRVFGDTGVTEVDWATGSTYSGDPGVDRHHLIFITSGSMQLRGFSRPGSIISSHLLPRVLELEWFFLTNSVVPRLTVCIYLEILK